MSDEAGCHKQSACDQAVVIVSFSRDMHRSFCNACVRQSGVMKQYTGEMLGHCEEADIRDGFWPANHGIGVLLFENKRECGKWTTSDPVFRSQDFLDQVEMYCVPLQSQMPQNCRILSILNLELFDPACQKNFSEQHEAAVKANGGACVAATQQLLKVKGLRSPAFMVLDAWESAEGFENWLATSANNEFGDMRRDVVLAQLSHDI